MLQTQTVEITVFKYQGINRKADVKSTTLLMSCKLLLGSCLFVALTFLLRGIPLSAERNNIIRNGISPENNKYPGSSANEFAFNFLIKAFVYYR